MALPTNPPSGRKATDPPRPASKAGADEKLRARVEGKSLKPQEAADLIGRLEAELAVLRNRHEQYFLGIDRQSPARDREALKGRIDELKFQVGRNTALKFQVQSLFSRFLSYERMWLRTEKDIEEGRYQRDIFKARLHAKERADAAKAAAPPPEAAPQATAQAPQPAKPVAVASRPPPVPAGLPSEDRMRAIYQAYVAAKKQCKESTAGLTYEQLANQLREQGPGLLKQTKGKALDFKVVIRDGKATLRAVAK